MLDTEPYNAELYNKAADLVEKGWTKGTLARDSAGWPTYPSSNHAVSWCLEGALVAAVHATDTSWDRESTLIELTKNLELKGYVSQWNDFPGRTKEQVVALLRDAADRSLLTEGE